VRANWFVSDFDHPTAGTYSTPGMPLQFSDTPVGFSHGSPLFAAHTTEVLTEVGLSPAAIQALVDAEVVVANGPDDQDS
jgi:crotonobetainyl-CoA:carnitine CoA-transferase CaiB-like acyl-CoA transferase